VVLGVVVTVKEIALAPPGTVAVGGTCATAGVLLRRVSNAPRGGALPFNVTVAVVDDPPVTVFGDNTSDNIPAGFTVRFAALLTANVAVTVTMVEDATPLVVIGNVAVRLPPATVTLDGVEADVLLSDRVTTVPAEGDGPLSVTVPVDELPPTTLVGLTVTELNVSGFMVKTAWAVLAR
jgi:hypothetical protein